jgi:PAP2 superfamily
MANARRFGRRTLRVAVAAAALLAPSLTITSSLTQPAAASTTNPVVVWDLNAQQAIWDVAGQAPQVVGRGFAMVHGAIYDAVNAIAGKPYQPYLVAPQANGAESKDAAVASAAFRVLSSLFPAQQARLQTQYDQFLAGIPDGQARRRGIAVGAQAADAMIASRRGDGAFGVETWTAGTQPGQWRPTAPSFASQGWWVGQLRPFLLPSPSMFRTSGPPALTSATYTRDFNEVKQIGAVDSTTRTPDQTDAARWWHDRRLTEWEIKRQLATGQRLDTLQAARFFAMVDLTEVDTVIACYNEKAAWNFWRPITAIQLADTDGNPATAADPNWTPLLVTPPHPDYTSGHSCQTAATMATFAYFFRRDNISFSATSADTGTTRHFDSFSEALAEVIEARIWGGIHTRTADLQGARIGASVFAYMAPRFFRPTR